MSHPEHADSTSLKPFFHPRTVAVIGASRDVTSIGYRLVDCLKLGRFTGRIVPVNPHATEIAGLQAVRSIAQIEGHLDLAIVAVPPNAVVPVIDECGAMGVPAAVLITAGFSETGKAGASLEAQLQETVRRHRMRLIGPNCFGVMNLDPAVHLNATFTPVVPPAGRIALASESGGLGITVVMAAHRLQLGLSSFASVGNHADVTVNDLLEYWEEDPATDVIMLYLETVVDPGRFRRIAERVGRRKPIIALKAGRTLAGQSAAGSHTAALATDERTVEALFEQCGVVRAKHVDEFIALAAGFSSQPLSRGPRVGILTNSGGPGVICADSCAAEGLIVPALSEQTQTLLGSFLPRTAALKNPVDMIGFAAEEQHAKAVETMLNAVEIDALIVLHMSVRVEDNPPVAAGIVRGIRAARRAAGKQKPVHLCWMAEGDLERSFAVDGETIPTFRQPEMAALVLARAVAYGSQRRQPPGLVPAHPEADVAGARTRCEQALNERGAGWLTVEELDGVLDAFHLPRLRGSVAVSADGAARIAGRIGFPVAVKLASHRIVHKTERGAVRLNLGNEQDVREAYETIRRRLLQDGNLEAMEGVLVQPMLSHGVEIAIGMARDPAFGPVMAFGLGGIHIEILRDVQFRLAPLTDRDVADMVRGIKGYRLLTGYRGSPAVDVQAIEALLLRVSSLVDAVPAITELDFNPVFALPDRQGCVIADARIRVGA